MTLSLVKRLLMLVILPLVMVCIIVYQLITYKLNEELAIQTMKRIDVAQKVYKESKDKGEYADLKELVEAGLLDSNLSDGVDHGYIFTVKHRDSNYYYAAARPKIYGKSAYQGTGGISIFLDSTGEVKVTYNEGKEPSPNDFPRVK